MGQNQIAHSEDIQKKILQWKFYILYNQIYKMKYDLNQSYGSLEEVQGYQDVKEININIKKDYNFGLEGAIGIQQGLSHFKEIQQLSLVIGKNNKINNSVTQILGQTIGDCQFLIRLNLVIEQNNIQNGIIHLLNPIQNCLNLQSFKLLIGNQNQVKDELFITLSLILRNLTSLNDFGLILEEGNLTTQNGLIHFSEGLKSCLNLLKFEIIFGKDELTTEGLLALKEGIGALQKLTHFAIETGPWNSIKSNGCLQISNTLLQFKQIQELRICIDLGNQISDEGVKYLSIGILSQQQLIKLSIIFGRFNNIGYNSIQLFFKNLIDCKNLLYLECLLYCTGNSILSKQKINFQVQLNHIKQIVSKKISLVW
ncbi:hypothetical protein TTHERM_001107439 (macronuclear) [Tetrahymena thermophila SB210]|uniref:Kinase domain protein n=1 Tax=Tetrahymena thermophila (strain SB210) TaxID=312017 RepID=W7X054_TETTS|nr:hypothetical protein TTHERM_001107439 [Tetrahymena thermophila SB210]EWS71247.1 hypothetical protein TTHERM_001107439 [Tetrahymena thermophila SB210]|eukprot:XP_012656220.1 hypothetical protein TTHERM_001107439 [Tetrahymena thermophila SB210]